MLNSDKLQKNTKYWYVCTYFKHSNGQLCRTYRLQTPIPVMVKHIGNTVEVYHWCDTAGSTGGRIWHPNYYNFSPHQTSGNYFANYVFETEEEAWSAYKKGIETEIERTEDLCKLKLETYKKHLREKKSK